MKNQKLTSDPDIERKDPVLLGKYTQKESSDVLTHDHDHLENISCRIGDSACAAKHVSAAQQAGLFHPMSKSQKIQSLLRLQLLYGNRFVQGVIDQRAIQARLRISQLGDIAKEKGEDRDDEVKIKRKSAICFSILRRDCPQRVVVEGKRQACPAPAPAAQRHRHLNATAPQIAGMGACDWGITVPDNLGIDIQTCRDGANWRLAVTRVNSVIRTHSRLLAGQAEPIPGVNTTAANFCDQVTELDNLGSCTGDWYMIRAVRAHEDVHIDEWRDNFTTDWTPLEATIEALTVPAAGATANRATAAAALQGTPVFQNARDTSNAGGNFPTFWGIPDPNAQTDAAERAVVDPRIKWICKRAVWDGWGPAGCPVCAAIGIT